VGMLTFYKANNATKVDFTHDKSADIMFRKNPQLLEFAKVMFYLISDRDE